MSSQNEIRTSDGQTAAFAAPRIRFEGFGGAWVEGFLGSRFEERLERSGEKQLLSVTMADGVIPASENGKRDNSSADKSNYKCVHPGDLAYNSMRMWQGACGASVHEGIVSPAYTVMKPNEETDSFFFVRLFKRPDSLKVLRAFSQGLTSDTWNLKFPMLSTIPCRAPSLPEQQRIASFFENLDRTIAATDARLEKLRQSKKALLEKMFPRPGQSVPEIRFKGFEGEWKESIIGDLFEERLERSGEKQLLSVTMADGVIPASENGKRDNSSADKSNYKCVYPGDLAYNSMRMWQGACGASNHEGIVSPAYTIMKPNHGTNSFFFVLLFKRQDALQVFRAFSQGLTSDTWNLKFPILSTISFKRPSLPEQQRIASFFRELDSFISATEAKSKKLRQVKAALLEGMFVQG